MPGTMPRILDIYSFNVLQDMRPYFMDEETQINLYVYKHM